MMGRRMKGWKDEGSEDGRLDENVVNGSVVDYWVRYGKMDESVINE